MVTQIAPRITIDPNVRFGKPVIEGTRVDVSTVLAHLAAGWDLDVVMREFGLTREDVLAAVAYAADVVAQGAVDPSGP